MMGNANNHARYRTASPLWRSALPAAYLWLMWLVFGTAPGWAEPVSNAQELYEALSQARGGETILLAPGDYGQIEISAKSKSAATFDTPVILASADPRRPASFSGFKVRDSANLVLDSLVFDYVFMPGHPPSARVFSVKDSDHITIRNSVFDGDVARGVSKKDDGFGYGYGLELSNGSDIRIENNEIFGFNRGIVTGGIRNLWVIGNDVHSIRSDGMDFVQVSSALIEGNRLHDFIRSPTSGDHSDMIQFWTRNTTIPSADITIRGNMLLSGTGDSTQSIFMRNDVVDRGMAGREMFYKNIRIEENVIVNGHLHGISLGETDGVVIRRNTLLRNYRIVNARTREKSVTIPRISVAAKSHRVEITNNVAAGFPAAESGWTVKDNLVAQDITIMRPGYYHKLFTDAQTGDPRLVNTFVVRKGSPADRPGLGAPLLRGDL